MTDSYTLPSGSASPTASDRAHIHRVGSFPYGEAINNDTLARIVSTRAFPGARTLRVLSLDGGGVKGYMALLILKRVFRTLNDVAGRNEVALLKPCHVFDLIVGTSTGGIIAAMLGRLEMTIEEALRQYEKVGKRVFKSGGPAGKLARALTSRPLFETDDLQAAIRDMIKGKKMREDARLCVDKDSNPECKVMLCVTNKETSKPDAFRNYVTTHAGQENCKCTIWEAASATAAVPSYFKRVKLTDGTKWVDGGCTPNRNNPIYDTLAELSQERSFEGREIGCILSIGNGVLRPDSVTEDIAPQLRKIIDMLAEAEEIAQGFENSDTGLRLEESKRFFRFSVPQGMQDLKMDDYKETNKMRALANLYLKDDAVWKIVQDYAEALFRPDENRQYMN